MYEEYVQRKECIYTHAVLCVILGLLDGIPNYTMCDLLNLQIILLAL